MKKPSILRFEREQRGWSQAKVAEELGVSTRTVVRWEQGLATPYPYYREQLSVLFGKSARELGLLAGAGDDEKQDAASLAPAVPSPSPSFLFDPMIPEAPGNANGLLGRDELLAQIKHRLLESNRVALTAINGLPGIGKTALAMALVTDRQIQEQYSDGILWAGLGPHASVLSLLTRWGSLLGINASDVENPNNRESWWRALHTAIGSRRMLFVIDDAWSFEDALALRVGGSNCAHIVTTRSPQVAFAFAQQETVVVPELEEADGLALLARFVPQFIEQDENAARELVRRVGMLPLAVKLMGYYLALQALSGQPRRLEVAVDALRNAQRRLEVNMPARWQEHPPGLPRGTPLSLQAVIAVSDQHLSGQAHKTLRALAVFPAKPNSFSEEMALAISQEPVETLDELWDVGLLEASGPGRYMLHQTIVDYARVQSKGVQARERLAHCTVQYLQIHKHDYENIELEVNNLQAGMEAAIELGMFHELFAAITYFVTYLRIRNHYILADHYLQIALKKATPQENPQERMILLQLLAEFAERREAYEQAESYIQQGLELARQHGQRAIISALLTTRGNVIAHRGDYIQAQAYFEEGLQLARQIGAKERICMLLCNLGRNAYLRGDYLQAESVLLEGIELARQQEYRELMISLLSYLGKAMEGLGDHSKAELYILESLLLARQLKD